MGGISLEESSRFGPIRPHKIWKSKGPADFDSLRASEKAQIAYKETLETYLGKVAPQCEQSRRIIDQIVSSPENPE